MAKTLCDVGIIAFAASRLCGARHRAEFLALAWKSHAQALAIQLGVTRRPLSRNR
jgi:hypothetical protein